MPGSSTIPRGNVQNVQIIYQPLVTVPNLAANATTTQSVTVQGAQVGDFFLWNQQSTVAGISVENIFVSAANTLTILWSNTTIAAVNATPPQPFLFLLFRAENIPAGGIGALPSGVTR